MSVIMSSMTSIMSVIIIVIMIDITGMTGIKISFASEDASQSAGGMRCKTG